MKPNREVNRYLPSVFDQPPPRRFRWWMALAVLSLALAGLLWCRDRAEAQTPKLPGFGYVPPPGACACLWRDGSAAGRGGPLDCWVIDQTAIPFFDQWPKQVPADYQAAVRRWHLHAKATDYFPPGKVPEGEEILVKGYIPRGCDAENWLGPRCSAALRQWCLEHNGTTHLCEVDPQSGRAMIELTDYLVVNTSPGPCPSGVGAGAVPPPVTPPVVLPPVLPPSPPPGPTPCVDIMGLPCTPTAPVDPAPEPPKPPDPEPPAPGCPACPVCPSCPPPVVCPTCDFECPGKLAGATQRAERAEAGQSKAEADLAALLAKPAPAPCPEPSPRCLETLRMLEGRSVPLMIGPGWRARFVQCRSYLETLSACLELQEANR